MSWASTFSRDTIHPRGTLPHGTSTMSWQQIHHAPFASNHALAKRVTHAIGTQKAAGDSRASAASNPFTTSASTSGFHGPTTTQTGLEYDRCPSPTLLARAVSTSGPRRLGAFCKRERSAVIAADATVTCSIAVPHDSPNIPYRAQPPRLGQKRIAQRPHDADGASRNSSRWQSGG